MEYIVSQYYTSLHFCSRLDAPSPRSPLCMSWQASVLKSSFFPHSRITNQSSWLTGVSLMPFRATWKTSKWEIMQPPPHTSRQKNIGLICWCVFYTWWQRASREQSLFAIVFGLCLQFASPLWWPKVRNKSWFSMIKFYWPQGMNSNHPASFPS